MTSGAVESNSSPAQSFNPVFSSFFAHVKQMFDASSGLSIWALLLDDHSSQPHHNCLIFLFFIFTPSCPFLLAKVNQSLVYFKKRNPAYYYISIMFYFVLYLSIFFLPPSNLSSFGSASGFQIRFRQRVSSNMR